MSSLLLILYEVMFQNLSTLHSLSIHPAYSLLLHKILDALLKVSSLYLRQYFQLGNQTLYIFLTFFLISHRLSIFCPNRYFWFFAKHYMTSCTPVSLLLFLPFIQFMLISISSMLLFFGHSGTLAYHTTFFCYPFLSLP